MFYSKTMDSAVHKLTVLGDSRAGMGEGKPEVLQGWDRTPAMCGSAIHCGESLMVPQPSCGNSKLQA